MVRWGDIELPDQSHYERLHLDDTIQDTALSLPERVNNIKPDELTRIATRCSS